MAPRLDAGAVQSGGEHFVTWVRGRAPCRRFASERAVRPPAGDLARAVAGGPRRDGAGRHLPPLLRQLREGWLAAAAQAPRIGRTGDADRI
jgi:hypothetical protein